MIMIIIIIIMMVVIKKLICFYNLSIIKEYGKWANCNLISEIRLKNMYCKRCKYISSVSMSSLTISRVNSKHNASVNVTLILVL